MSSPWAKIATPSAVNFSEIMSEQMAEDLQEKENMKSRKTITKDKQQEDTSNISEDVLASLEDDELAAFADDACQSDAQIARMLQMQYDKEHDEQLRLTESKINGHSKVSVSFSNFKRVPRNDDFESDSEEEEIVDIRDRKNWDRFDTLQKEINSIPACGYKVNQDGTVTTKHDIAMNGRKNACKILSFPPEFQTGDGENFDMQLSNKVYNRLKIHSRNEQARKHRTRDKREDLATASFGLDQSTTLILYKWGNSQLLESINGIVSIGKEAVILHATSDPNYPECDLPHECAIKVFKTTVSEFKQRDQYIRDDHRFRDRMGKQSSKKTVPLWAEKEMANLCRIERAGIPCPHVIKHKQHCLVMSFIGENNIAAPKLKDAQMEAVDYIMAYEEIVESMKTLYNKANLIHGDLSEYNILWYRHRCYFIDVSQAVEPEHNNALTFLMRDCRNIINFFTRKNVPNILTSEELFKAITGHYFEDEVGITTVQKMPFKMKPHLVDKLDIEPPSSYEPVWDEIADNVLSRTMVDLDTKL